MYRTNELINLEGIRTNARTPKRLKRSEIIQLAKEEDLSLVGTLWGGMAIDLDGVGHYYYVRMYE